MAYKIILDAGHGGTDPGATYNGRQEKDDALRLAVAVGELLQNAGFDVVYTRTTDVYDTPFEKATIGNNAGGNLFVSFHRNSSPQDNMYSGVQTLIYNDEGLKAELAKNINANLEAVGFENKGVILRPNLVVLRRTKMPSVLIEAGFINSDRDNELFDSRFDEMAQAIADAIIDTLQSEGIQVSGHEVYSVQVGAFRNRQLAANMAMQLRSRNFPARVEEEEGLYKVKVGSYEDLDNAVQIEQQLRSMGYNTFISS